MAKKSPYVCFIYEVGDEVSSKYSDGEEVHVIVKAEFKKLESGTPYQLLWLDSEDSFPVISSHYCPIGNSIDKYREGVPLYGNSNVKVKPERQVSKTKPTVKKEPKQEVFFNPKAAKLPTDAPNGEQPVEDAPVFISKFKVSR